MAAKPRPVTVHLMHASMNMFEPAGAKEDFRFIFREAKPDMVSFTEMATFRGELREVAENNGYRGVLFGANPGQAIAINTETVKLKSKDYKKVSTAAPGIPARYVNWIETKVEGETIWYHTAHWLAKLYLGGGRQPRHNAMSRQIAAQVRKHAQKGDISFFSGDWNLDDNDAANDPRAAGNQIFREEGLLTIWDEFKVYPNTKGLDTIDIIGSYNKDGRVTGKRHKRWPKQNSDHRFVSAWYEIEPKKNAGLGGIGGGGNGGGGGGGGASGGGGAGGGTGPDPAQDDFYATGGNIDWSDYFDGAIYNLPQATDDSDGPTHGDTIT